MSLFTINEKKCKRDGICVSECPLKLIEMKDGSSTPTPTADAEERCVKCGHCVAVCPHEAFTHSAMKNEDFPPVRKDFALTSAQAEHFLRARRSIRSYQDKPVEREKVAGLINIARYAPTGTNSQQVGWIAVNSREEVKKLTSMVIDMIRKMVEAKSPFAEKYRLANAVTAWDSGIDTISRGAPALVFAHAPKDYGLAQVDCTSALSYFDLAAPTFGLGTCWAGFVMIALAQWPPLQQALALPEGHAAFGAMMLGYPKYKYSRLPPRNEARITWRE
jgi:nitroreductase/NAD-dependent dihydropyrimidine dehydrogenase PreA subunit